MHAVDRDGVTVDVCDGCRGAWLDRGEVEKLIPLVSHGVPRALAATGAKAAAETLDPLRCVRCAHRMVRRPFADGAAVVVDLCRAHGMWFDGGELEHVAAFVKAGGLERSRRRDENLEGVRATPYRKRKLEAAEGFAPADLALGLLLVRLL